MTIKTYVEDLSTVDENLQAFYKPMGEEGEGYILDAEPVGGYAVENVEGLKSALQKERGARKDFESKYAKIEKQFEGVDLEEINSLKSEYEKLQQKYEKVAKIDPESEASKLAEEKIKEFEEKHTSKLTAKQKEWQKLHEKEVGERDKTIGTLKNQLSEMMIDSSAKDALVNAKIRSEHLELLLPKVTGAMKLAESEDGVSVEITDNEGNPRVRSDGQNMTVKDLVVELQEKWPDSFNADAKSGGGTKSTSANGATSKKREDMDSKELIAAGLAARMGQ